MTNDSDTQLWMGRYSQPQWCLHVKPGYWGDFPPRCARRPGHEGPHRGATRMSWGAVPMDADEWPNNELEQTA